MNTENHRTPMRVLALVVSMVALMGTSMAWGQEAALSGRLSLTDACPLYQQFTQINNDWREGKLSERDLVLKKADAAWGNGMYAATSSCDPDLQNLLKDELLTDIHRLADELNEADKTQLASLNTEVTAALAQTAPEAREQESETIQAEESTAAHSTSATDRVNKALEQGQISLTESVLLRAQLEYAPHRLTSGSEFMPTTGEPLTEEGSETALIKDLHRAKDRFTGQERRFLALLDPTLKAIIASWENPTTNALPVFPDLTKKFEGKKCIVHYTLTGANKVANDKYAAWVASWIDDAISRQALSGHFRAAYAEGGGKLHVYILELEGSNAEWIDESNVAGSGKRKSGWIKIDNNLDQRYGTTWLAKLKGVAHHEYFHGVQSAYNWESDLWFMEATTVWASCYYGADYTHLGDYYKASNSIFNQPNQNIWVNTFHKYSTSVLAFYLSGRFSGYPIIKSYFAQSEKADDAIVNLRAVLAGRSAKFDEVFKEFLIRLYTKSISGIKSYMPDVKLARTIAIGKYGVPLTPASVKLLGANFYKLAKPTDARLLLAPLITVIDKTGDGSPQGILVANGSTKPAPIVLGRSYLPKTNDAVLIATDVGYAGRDTASRAYKYSVYTPYIKIRKVTSVSPITGGQSSPIHIYYDLLGIAGVSFPVTLQVTAKGPDVDDRVSGTYNTPVGENRDFPLFFNTGTSAKGTYSFTFQLRVPPDDWKIPQVKGNGSTTVVVLPSGSSQSSMGDKAGILEALETEY